MVNPGIIQSRLLKLDEYLKILQMIGFRNALVHDYADVDREIVFKVLHERLPVFEDLKKVMALWL